MLKSSVYQRLRAESPKEFEPKAIFFFSEGEAEAIDWQNSFWLKAAVVYHAITGTHVNPRATPKASLLLVEIAKNCRPEKAMRPPAPAARPAAPFAAPAPAKAEEINEEFVAKLPVELKKFVDGVYLVVGYLPALKSAVVGKWDRKETDNFYVSTRSHQVVADIIKIGNQVPLESIRRIVECVEDAIKKAKDAFPASNADNKRLRYDIEKYKLSFSKESFHEVLYPFCWYYSPFYYKPNTPENEKFVMDEVVEKSNFLFECVHEYVKHAWGRQSSTPYDDAGGSGYLYSMPTARQLQGVGIRFVAVDVEGSAAIRFAEPVLSMPRLIYDFKVETVVRNLIALESLRGDYPKPFTRYFQFMNELVEDIGDIKVLRTAGVICGGSKAGKEVLEMVKKVDGYASYPSTFAAIDEEVEKARDFITRKLKFSGIYKYCCMSNNCYPIF